MRCHLFALFLHWLLKAILPLLQLPSSKTHVKDATGEPIIGATIRIEGKTGGTVTDLDGNFTLSNIEKGAKLTITYVGYKSQTLTWSGSPLNITLQDDANMLEETVVIGYGTVKKADLAGSVAVLDSKNFKDQPVARVEDALNGRMSGVQVMSSGVPGGAMKIRVRGASSVNKSNDPLYVVDGIVRETGLKVSALKISKASRY